MKKIFLSMVMALACVGANAQVETTPIISSIDGLYGIYGIPDAYLYDRKEYIVGQGEYNNKLYVYDEELKLVKEINSAEEITSFEWRNMADNAYGSTTYLTQTLFNDDEKFEYIVSIQGDNSSYGIKGVKIMSESGKVLQTLFFNKNASDIYVIQVGSNNYIGCCGYDDMIKANTINLYKINKNSDPSKVSIATTPVNIKVSPRVAERNQDITVAAEGEGIREVVVSDASGRIVYSTKAAAGQQTVKLNSLYLSSGLNIVSVKSADGKSENCKVVVKK